MWRRSSLPRSPLFGETAVEVLKVSKRYKKFFYREEISGLSKFCLKTELFDANLQFHLNFELQEHCNKILKIDGNMAQQEKKMKCGKWIIPRFLGGRIIFFPIQLYHKLETSLDPRTKRQQSKSCLTQVVHKHLQDARLIPGYFSSKLRGRNVNMP